MYDIALRPYDNNAASVSLYDRNILKPNFAKIAFAFGSVKLGLDTSNIRYVLDENLNPLAVENVRYKLDLGDFDFEGGEGSEEVNKILRQIADPSGIGKKVNLEFDKEAKIYAGNITKEDYASLKDWKDLKTKLGVDNPPAPIDNELSVKMVKYAKFLDEFNRIKEVSKAIDYLDENGKIVMFRGNENDKMVGTKAANFDYSDNVDADWFPDAAADLLLNHYKKHIPNGITYVGGAGSDRITGTDYDDILYGHDKEGKDDDEATDTLVGGKGSDKLYGGKGDDILVGHTGSMIDDNIRDELYGGDGFDTYYVGDKDVIFDSDGKGKVVLENKELTGGIYDENQNAYLSPDKTLKYYLSGNETTLIVKDIVSGKTVIIDNYSKDKKSLGIELSQAPLEEIAILSDTTGSMGLAIDSVKTQAMDIVNLAFSRDANARIGVFGYNDPGVQTFTHLTNDKNAVLSAINSLYASGGGDWPEMTWHGVYNAAMSNWSEKSVKRLFVFGDAPAKDEEFKQAALDALSGKNISMISGSAPGGSTSTAGVGRGAIEVYAIQTGGGKEVSSDFKELAQKSGGKFINLEEYNARDYSVADAIYDSINSGTAKDDVLKGNEKNNRIEAGAGNDKIYGGKGDDVITGGAGDDTIYGEDGADTFKFNPGDGNDLIYAGNGDVIELGEGISKDDVEFKVAGASFESLRIELKNTKEGIIAHDALNNEKAAFKKVKFADGTSLSFKEIVSGLNLQKLLNGSEANDEIVGTKFSDTVYAKGGNDKISTKEGNDYIYAADGDDEIDGGAGDDLIFGGKGNDVITGGAGDDTIYGEEGADTFKFNPGDGNDTLYTDSSDKLILNAVKAGDVKFKYENNHLRVSYSQNDSALLINYALNQSNQIKGIELDDGSYITSKKINETMQKISEYLKENQAGENDPQIKNIMMSGWSQGGEDGWSL